MRILLWHGYLLGGTGSNVYTRQLAREWSRGHDVVVFCQEPASRAYDVGGAAVVRPDVGGLLPVFVLDRYEGYEAQLLQECTRGRARPLGRGERRGAARATSRRSRLLQPRPARRSRSARRPARPMRSRRTARSSSTRCAAVRSSRPGDGTCSTGATAVYVGSAHIREVLEEVCGHVDRVHEVPPGVDIDEWRPRPRAEALAALLEEARHDPPNPGNAERAPSRRGERRAARGVSRRRRADGRLLREAAAEQGRPPPARGAARASTRGR